MTARAGASRPRPNIAINSTKPWAPNLPNDEVDTIGGYVIDHLARMPHKSEIVQIGNLKFEILRADARQIHVLLVEKLPVAEVEDAVER
jgi:Mg2+/Co2+ transporter CorC